jgi:hypothetical protein
LKIGNESIEFLPDFIYLGINFSSIRNRFLKHVARRVKAAIFASSQLHSLPKVSMEIALKLFDLKTNSWLEGICNQCMIYVKHVAHPLSCLKAFKGRLFETALFKNLAVFTVRLIYTFCLRN